MNVATASATAYRPVEFMTARPSQNGAQEAGGRTPSGESQAASVFQRFPIVAFSFETNASRLVMHFRDPDTGHTVSQIPSEAALKQYEERQKNERREERRERFEVIVGGAAVERGAGAKGSGNGAAGASAAGGASTGAPSSGGASTGGASTGGASTGAYAAGSYSAGSYSASGGLIGSGGGASAFSGPTGGSTAAVSGGSGAGGSSGSVNLVI